ncbi:ribosomal-protein-alanine N-acetyltransferase [Virgibacillus subterraneus]|uniref:Ribosomal-protein-alanine N-acetyltransferase n=1 Tax=Virgibacillus subterraneus TaxID=621109 RepID=A0A1H9K5M8_9BACI|nr:GNAT family protein [Virgibacillus subterraneus]SEQ94526.1 ribosomal-protein-alanine N-acetyltransferase [Virgibacillus subterraneus]
MSLTYLFLFLGGLVLGLVVWYLEKKNKWFKNVSRQTVKAYTGKGIANTALKLLLETIRSKQRIKQVSAKTTTNNIASQKVLEKNGFKYIAASDEEIIMNGQKVKFVYYLLTN